MLFSVIGAVVLGGSLAWTETQISAVQQSTVGDLAFSLQCATTGELLGPNGSTSTVGNCQVTNDGTFNLAFNPAGSSTYITGTNDGAACTAGNFIGAMIPGGDFVVPGFVLAPGDVGQGLQGKILTLGTAPNGCQGVVVSWVMAVTMETSPN